MIFRLLRTFTHVSTVGRSCVAAKTGVTLRTNRVWRTPDGEVHVAQGTDPESGSDAGFFRPGAAIELPEPAGAADRHLQGHAANP